MDHETTQGRLAKLRTPKYSRVLDRERLFTRLDQCRARPCVWVTGPGGAGKTTLVARYIAVRELPALWYQVDEGEADPAALFHYLSLAAEKCSPKKAKPLPPLTPEHVPGIATFTRLFFGNYSRVFLADSCWCSTITKAYPKPMIFIA